MDREKDTDESNVADEQRFLRMFSKQLAEALRAKDEEEAEEGRRNRGDARSLDKNGETNQWERIRLTYSELCHDYPVVSGGDGDCRRLGSAFIPKKKRATATSGREENQQRLGLSSRLVDGVLQATSRAASNVPQNSAGSSAQSNETKVASTEQESMFGSSNLTTSQGYAEIAFAIFVEGPYRCIQQADNLSTASSFLGSFQPHDASDVPSENLSAEEKSRLVDEATENLVRGMDKMSAEGESQHNNLAQDDASSSSSEFFRPNSGRDMPQRFDEDNNSMEEVFAEESDPDDYNYGSSDNPYSPSSDVQATFCQKTELTDEYDVLGDYGFDALQLSEPSASNKTWQGARKSLKYLLSNISYGKLVLGSLSSRVWSERGMSETLADLSFVLILENTKRRGDGTASRGKSLLHVGKDEGQLVADDITELWDRPLFLLRDRSLDENHGHDALPAYLQLVTAFLSHSEPDITSILSSLLGKCTSDNVLPPVSTVGLSSLASICSSKEMRSSASGRMCGTSAWSVCPREEMKKAIVTSLNSISRIVECIRPRKSIFATGGANMGEKDAASENSTWIRTVACIIPCLEYLTNLQARFDFQPMFEGGSSSNRNATLPDSDAKAISNSGLLRELLLLYTATQNNDKDSSAEGAVRMQLLRTIFTLSSLSSDLLGRYAVRVPDFTKEVHSSDFMERNLVDGILWTSMGSSLLEGTSDTVTPRLKLRSNSKLKAKVTTETTTLAERSFAGFEKLMSSVGKSLQKLQLSVKAAESGVLSDEDQREYDACRASLSDIIQMSNCLSYCPSATSLWLDSLKNNEGSTQKAMSIISDLKSTLASIPSIPDEAKDISQCVHKKDDADDDECTGNTPRGEAGQKQSSRQLQRDYGLTVALVRSSVKVIALALESQKSSGLSLKGLSPYDVSSKTD
ncbi:hypothetical protein ACHAWF_016075 [Thalassiosira exigua]